MSNILGELNRELLSRFDGDNPYRLWLPGVRAAYEVERTPKRMDFNEFLSGAPIVHGRAPVGLVGILNDELVAAIKRPDGMTRGELLGVEIGVRTVNELFEQAGIDQRIKVRY